MDYDLKLQAYLDGELGEEEAREIAALLERDLEAGALRTELLHTRQALRGFEEGVRLPESREFFWSKIQREIERQPKGERGERAVPFWARLQRFLVPASAVALLGMGLFSTLGHAVRSTPPGELELVSDDMGALTFRSQSEQMTMVWLYDRGETAFADPGEIE